MTAPTVDGDPSALVTGSTATSSRPSGGTCGRPAPRATRAVGTTSRTWWKDQRLYGANCQLSSVTRCSGGGGKPCINTGTSPCPSNTFESPSNTLERATSLTGRDSGPDLDVEGATASGPVPERDRTGRFGLADWAWPQDPLCARPDSDHRVPHEGSGHGTRSRW